MRLDRARFLVSEQGRDALAGIPKELGEMEPLRLGAALRKAMPSEEAAAIAEQLTLRRRYPDRFLRSHWLFTEEGAQMMTHPLVARRRAARLAANDLPVIDATVGIGGDLRACRDHGIHAMGIEIEAATALIAGANCDGLVVRGDARTVPANLDHAAVIVDPSRRSARGRRFDPAAFSPSWTDALALAASAALGVVKAPPGIAQASIPDQAEFEVVQVGRSLREATIWMGRTVSNGLRRAVSLPAGVELTSAGPGWEGSLKSIGQFVFDPESCVTRAGLVRQLAHELGAWMLDEHVAYLSGEAPMQHRLATAFRVLDVLPFSVGRIKGELRRKQWRPVEIRRRAFPVEPDELRRLLGAMDGEPVALLCTTIAGQRLVVVGEEQRNGEDG